MVIRLSFLLLKQVSLGPYIRKIAFIAPNPPIFLLGGGAGEVCWIFSPTSTLGFDEMDILICSILLKTENAHADKPSLEQLQPCQQEEQSLTSSALLSVYL